MTGKGIGSDAEPPARLSEGLGALLRALSSHTPQHTALTEEGLLSAITGISPGHVLHGSRMFDSRRLHAGSSEGRTQKRWSDAEKLTPPLLCVAATPLTTPPLRATLASSPHPTPTTPDHDAPTCRPCQSLCPPPPPRPGGRARPGPVGGRDRPLGGYGRAGHHHPRRLGDRPRPRRHRRRRGLRHGVRPGGGRLRAHRGQLCLRPRAHRHGHGRGRHMAGPARPHVRGPGLAEGAVRGEPGVAEGAHGRVRRRAQLLAVQAPGRGPHRHPALRAVDGPLLHRGEHRRRYRAHRPGRPGIFLRHPADPSLPGHRGLLGDRRRAGRPGRTGRAARAGR